MPGHPRGKAAGEACVNLTDDWRCGLWGRLDRPAFCAGLQPAEEMCGATRAQAIAWLAVLERETCPPDC